MRGQRKTWTMWTGFCQENEKNLSTFHRFVSMDKCVSLHSTHWYFVLTYIKYMASIINWDREGTPKHFI